ncbi:MAG: YrhK family protein [Pseudomonadota bacterium]|nr:YrhK family protein [Pseudomonadota bacterium]
MSNASTPRLPYPLHALVCDYEWIHICLGLIGNLAFVAGSFLFFSASTKQLALWLFVIGSFGMLIGSMGSAFVKYERKQRDD